MILRRRGRTDHEHSLNYPGLGRLSTVRETNLGQFIICREIVLAFLECFRPKKSHSPLHDTRAKINEGWPRAKAATLGVIRRFDDSNVERMECGGIIS